MDVVPWSTRCPRHPPDSAAALPALVEASLPDGSSPLSCVAAGKGRTWWCIRRTWIQVRPVRSILTESTRQRPRSWSTWPRCAAKSDRAPIAVGLIRVAPKKDNFQMSPRRGESQRSTPVCRVCAVRLSVRPCIADCARTHALVPDPDLKYSCSDSRRPNNRTARAQLRCHPSSETDTPAVHHRHRRRPRTQQEQPHVAGRMHTPHHRTHTSSTLSSISPYTLTNKPLTRAMVTRGAGAVMRRDSLPAVAGALRCAF